MPFVLIIAGILLVVVAIRNTQSQLGRLIVGDFTGPGNFFYWIAAILIIGLLGEIDELEKPSRMFLALIILAMVLKNPGFFAKFVEQLKQGSASPPPPGPPNPNPTSGTAGGSGGPQVRQASGGPLGQAGQIIGAATGILSVFGL